MQLNDNDINHIIDYTHCQLKKLNIDNISRTKAYQTFYQQFPEIKWAFLASIVSRNAGWNMTDLQTPVFQSFLSQRIRKQLFSTYERANWLIFSDAYPQLIVYKFSKKWNMPLFHLLDYFAVSTFMKREWKTFWNSKNEKRLMYALIINEQNVIEKPVTEHPFYRKHVFLNWPYLMQNYVHMNAVLLPSLTGYGLGFYVKDFTSVSSRIKIGKKLASALFLQDIYEKVYDFAIQIEHTGSRQDYESYYDTIHTEESPMLRMVYPIIEHKDKVRGDWYVERGVSKKWWDDVSINRKANKWNSFYRKRKLMQKFYQCKKTLSN